ncbi:MAG: UrcA family protein [Sphingomicrobium sp.]
MDARKTACLAASACVGILLVSVAAGPALGVPTSSPEIVVKPSADYARKWVSYSDLSLVNRADQRTLRTRISAAADEVCGPALGYSRFHDEPQQYCVFDAVDAARPQLAKAIERAKLQATGIAVGPPVAITIIAGGR